MQTSCIVDPGDLSSAAGALGPKGLPPPLSSAPVNDVAKAPWKGVGVGLWSLPWARDPLRFRQPGSAQELRDRAKYGQRVVKWGATGSAALLREPGTRGMGGRR